VPVRASGFKNFVVLTAELNLPAPAHFIMKNKIFVLFIFLFLLQLVSAVEIHQVLYDPLNSDTGGEAVELYNPSDDEINISGWVIATSTSDKDVTFPKNSFIAPKSYFLVADVGWNSTKQSGWRNADYEETMTLPNDDSGIALKNNNLTIIDAVGWGNVSKESLYRGSPTVNVLEGFSLLRISNTNNNFVDFVSSVPVFDVPQSVFVELEVVQQSVVIKQFELLADDSNVSGTQIIPFAGIARNVSVRAVIDGTNTAHLQFGESVFALQKINSSVFEGSIVLQHYLPPNNYSVMLVAESSTAFLNFTYLPLKKFVVSPSFVRLRSVAGETVVSESVVVRNVGNVPVNVSARLNELRGTNSSITTTSVSLMFGSVKKSSSIELTLLPADEQLLKLSVNVPQDAVKGKYVSSLIFQD